MKRPLALAVFGTAVTLLLAAGCSSGSQGSAAKGGTPQQGGSVTFAMPPNATPNWIFPIGTPGHLASFNGSIRQEVFVPLYYYDGTSGTVALDEKAGAAKPPVYSDGGKTVDIKLNPLTWANGQKVTSRDVEFWFNLVKANKTQWGNYNAGDLPDNIARFETVSDTEFKLHLTKAYNPDWFTANQLAFYVTPIRRRSGTSRAGVARSATTTAPPRAPRRCSSTSPVRPASCRSTRAIRCGRWPTGRSR